MTQNKSQQTEKHTTINRTFCVMYAVVISTGDIMQENHSW